MSQPPTRRVALCIGVADNGQNKGKLRFAVKNALEIAAVLRDPNRGGFDDVREVVASGNTTAIAIRRAIKNVLKSTPDKPVDVAVIYLCSHGTRIGNTYYLLPSETSREGDGQLDTESMISVLGLADIFNDATVPNIVLWLDTCYAGGGTDLLYHVKFKPGHNVFVLGAARQDQTTEESGEIRQSIFANALLRAFTQRPKHDSGGWLSVTDIETFVAEQIPKPQQIQVHTQHSDPNLRLIFNPDYAPENAKFAEEIKGLVTLNGKLTYCDDPVPDDAPPGYFLLTPKNNYDAARYGVLARDNSVLSISIEKASEWSDFLSAQRNDGYIDNAYFVTEQPLSSDLQTLIVKNNRWLRVRTRQKLLNELVDFRPFMRKLERELFDDPFIADDPVAPSLDKIYIHLRARRPLNPPEVEDGDFYAREKRVELARRDLSTPKVEMEEGDLGSFVQEWLNDANKSRLVLVADYGSGKTTFSKYLAGNIARAYLRGGIDGRIPLLFRLGALSGNYEPSEQRLVEYLNTHGAMETPSVDVLRTLAEEGKLLFIFDGFDELALQADKAMLERNIALFATFEAMTKNKVLLTTRPEYFTRLSEENHILGNRPRLDLKPLSTQQIQHYLELRLGVTEAKRDWAEIERFVGLSDLADRPVLLEMIVRTLPSLRNRTEPVDRPTLYKTYLIQELERQRKQRRDMQIAEEELRFEIMEAIALAMHRSNKQRGMTDEEIWTACKQVLNADNMGNLKGATRNILTCSFLLREGDLYRFSHNSFYEYLLARALKGALDKREPNDFAITAASHDTLAFIAEMKPDIAVIQAWVQWPEATNEVGLSIFGRNLAGLMLACRLNDLEEGQISDYITNAEYQLFVDQQAANEDGLYVQPENWPNIRYSDKQALEPVSGINYFLARWFTDFLDHRTTGWVQDLPLGNVPLDPQYPHIGAWTYNSLRLDGMELIAQKVHISWHGNDLDFSIGNVTEQPRTNTFSFENNAHNAIFSALDLPSNYESDDISLNIRTRALSLSQFLSLDLAFGLALDLAYTSFSDETDAICNGKYAEARRRVFQTARTATRIEDRRLATLLIDSLSILSAFNYSEMRAAHRTYTRHYADFIIAGLALLEQVEQIPNKYTAKKVEMQRLKMWVDVVEARIGGELPAWEGIRIVRTRKQADDVDVD